MKSKITLLFLLLLLLLSACSQKEVYNDVIQTTETLAETSEKTKETEESTKSAFLETTVQDEPTIAPSDIIEITDGKKQVSKESKHSQEKTTSPPQKNNYTPSNPSTNATSEDTAPPTSNAPTDSAPLPISNTPTDSSSTNNFNNKDNNSDSNECNHGNGRNLVTSLDTSVKYTCGDMRYTVTKCAICHYVEPGSRKEEEVLTHHKTYKVITNSTCSARGTANFYCMICGLDFGIGESYGPLPEHTFEKWQMFSPANCQTKSVYTSSCTMCGTTESKEGGDAMQHSRVYDSQIREMTCQQTSIDIYKCIYCEDKIEVEGGPLDCWDMNNDGCCDTCGGQVSE